ncbi:NCS1 nucleoside transporter [Microdochium trichocladiopsis]|uniref:NCS1 nucleoside transporter n=1 Tax=Microdochium trichocladiopsis TaxID=1682393 RepID=A0A9P8XV34_9PEZI|nr:NCS1 nucleoside transporter [Microdochium trichocladiopsis]KAH7020733.1 NCS1 nucleoside transporter [Microdochium trichocladiopsis]
MPKATLPSKDEVKARMTTIEAWKLPKQTSSVAPADVWTNADQDPVPLERRTWGSWAFCGYWLSDLLTVATWQTGSSILIVGLGTNDAILIMFVSGICNMIATILNGHVGATLHVPFPIAIRSSYGYWFSYFCVVSRAILAAFWLGIQSVGGGAAVGQAITCIWPSFATLPNTLPPSAGITTKSMVSYVIFHLIQFPFLLIPSHKLQKLFLVKSILVPPMAVGMLIWICVKANGVNAILNQPATLTGSACAWAWLAALTSITGGWYSLSVNISDFTRMSRDSRAHLWQAPFIPGIKIITSLFGIVAMGAGRVVYGQDMWTPLELIAKWEGSGGRFLGFVCSMLWVLAQVSCNISANSFSFANDVTSLFPKWINIRRGTILCSLLGGFALVPWLMVSSAYVFLSFMSGYAIFLGPMSGMLTCDFWLIQRGKYDVPGLYDPEGRYRYWHGINWRALLTTVLIMTPLLPGLANAVSPKTVSIDAGLKNLYNISWLYGYHATILVYWLLNYFFPAKGVAVVKTIQASEDEMNVSESIEVAGGTSVDGSVEEKKVSATEKAL